MDVYSPEITLFCLGVLFYSFTPDDNDDDSYMSLHEKPQKRIKSIHDSCITNTEIRAMNFMV